MRAIPVGRWSVTVALAATAVALVAVLAGTLGGAGPAWAAGSSPYFSQLPESGGTRGVVVCQPSNTGGLKSQKYDHEL